jgi:hypothetical protein
MVRSAVTVLVAIVCVCGCPGRAMAQDSMASSDQASLFVAMTAPASTEGRLPGSIAVAERGPVLAPMYASLIGLQAYDGYSTNRGLQNGATESNAAIGAVSRHPAAVWAAKGATAFASIYVAERLWRQHRRGQAIVLMVVSNGIMAAVAANNAAIVRRQP